jgi:hypothetical protein
VIIGQSTNTKQEIATESCSTSPAATFKRMANGEVHKKDDTVQVADQVPDCIPHRLPDYSWSWCPAVGAVPAPLNVPEAVAAPAPAEDPEDPEDPEEDPELVPEAIVSPAPEDPEDPEDPEGDPELVPEAIVSPAPEDPEDPEGPELSPEGPEDP